jgi:transcriptional regulator with XRE-family HTH domain
MIYGLSEKIKNSRIQKGLTQVQVSKRLNVTKSAVNAWETNGTTPSLIYIVKLAQIFNVSTDYLLGLNEREGLSVSIESFNDLQKEAILSLASVFNRMNDKNNRS